MYAGKGKRPLNVFVLGECLGVHCDTGQINEGCISCYASSSLENFPPSAAVLPQIYQDRKREGGGEVKFL